MPDPSFPRLLFVSEKTPFSISLYKKLSEMGVEVFFADPYVLLKDKQLSSYAFEYILCNFVSVNKKNAKTFTNTLLFETAQKNESKVAFLLPFTIQTKEEPLISKIIDDIRVKAPNAALIFLSLLTSSAISYGIKVKGKKIHLPEKTSILSFDLEDTLFLNLTRNLFSLRAYGHMQALLGEELSVERLAEFFEEHGMSPSYDKKIFKSVPLVMDEYRVGDSSDAILSEFAHMMPTKSVQSQTIAPERVSYTKVLLFKKRNITNNLSNLIRKAVAGTLAGIRYAFAFIQNIIKTLILQSKNLKTKIEEVGRKKSKDTAVVARSYKKMSSLVLPKMRSLHINFPKVSIIEWLPRKKMVYALGVFVGLVFLPYLLSFSVFLIALIGLRGVLGNYEMPAKIATPIAHIAKSISSYYIQVEPAASFYKQSFLLANVSTKLTDSAQDLITIKDTTAVLVQNIFSGEDSNMSSYIDELSFSYDSLYTDLGFAESDLENLDILKPLLSIFIDKNTLEDKRNESLNEKKLVKTLPMMFGEKEPVTYLVALQNSSSIRAVGGEIEAVAFVTFWHGSVKNIETYSVKEADALLKGKVSPPTPLEKYAGKGSWFLQDANWEYPFVNTAERIKWFIDKEFDRQVSGVVAVSDSFFKTSEHTPANSDEWKKFLESNLKSLFESLKNNTLTGGIANALSQRQILFAFTDPQIEETFETLGWTGAFQKWECQEKCASDSFGVLESNFGNPTTKIERKGALLVAFEDGHINKKFDYSLQNNGDTTYKTYIRLITDKQASLSAVTVQTEVDEKKINSDSTEGIETKEEGVYIEVVPMQKKTLTFYWKGTTNLQLQKAGEYHLFVMKQAGIPPYPLSLSLYNLGRLKTLSTPLFLTKGEALNYNTVLSQDFTSKIFWKEQ